MTRVAVTVTQLMAFLTVVRRGSVTAAAEELVVTQPSVSAALNALQRELGVALMERDGRNVRPTAAGRAYVPYATGMLGLLEQGARAARDATMGVRRSLRIGAVTTAGEYVVPPMLRTFREAYSELEIALAVGNSAEIFQQLLAHEIDVAITGRVPDGVPLVGEPFATNPFLLITAPSDPLAKLNSVAIDDLAGRPWLLRERGSGTRLLCEEYLASHGVRPTTLTLGSNGAIKQAAGLGLGIALQSRCAVQVEVEMGLLATIPVRGGLPRRRWHVVHPSVQPVHDQVRAFIRFAQSKAGRHALAAVAPPLT